MNVCTLITPKQKVAYIYEDYTIRQALEKMKHYGYTAIPVLNRDGEYIGTIGEGDLLWYLIDTEQDELQKINVKNVEHVRINDVLNLCKNKSVSANCEIEDLMSLAINQNFVPIVDDKGSFMGIITRKQIIKYFYDEPDKK